ncbi:hypothetical protein [Actinoallomurus iriomotensis]|uniref:Uncharacterized protein n=1 Tax=Actinoallomurus iriomotensis TaxID=478107 RepID=A0A9W6RE88_9ACTN|nr:hypothetical protein [Actinoallomurus iriomotensis]GLY73994.1 hypothetical protein Airi01_022610 [Actinoallomurus iriomotensis]
MAVWHFILPIRRIRGRWPWGAFGTAPPEPVVTATTGAASGQEDIGVGAAVGGLLVPATVTYGATGAALLIGGNRTSLSRSTDRRSL